MKKAILAVLFLFLSNLLLFAANKPSIPDSSQLQLMVNKLSVVGGVLYIAAHPDDENTAVLAAMSQGRLVRAGYLSLTRGDGGQNLIGPEQGPLLGLIRTQELLAARNVDRAQQFFTRAIDFGYTKSSEETLRFWGHDNILSDVVWVIRKFRPDVLLCRFPVSGGGHGQHTASATLAEEAFAAAADPKRFPEQLQYVKPWQAKRILWNYYKSTPATEAEKAALIPFEAGAYNPLLGLSYTEIAGVSRSMHKSQGFGDSEDRGSSVNYFQLVAGEPAKTDLFDGVDLSWKRIPQSESLQKTIAEVQSVFRPENPSAVIPLLLKAKSQMDALPANPWVEEKKLEVLDVIRACSGLWLEAIAAEESGVPGGSVKISASAINRSSVHWKLERIELLPDGKAESISAELAYNQPLSKELVLQIPASANYSEQYWLAEPSDGKVAVVKDPLRIGDPESAAPIHVKFRILLDGNNPLEFLVPVLYRRVDPVRGEIYRRFEIVPEVAVNIEDPVLVFANAEPKPVDVRLHASSGAISGTLRLKLPAGWTSDPSEIPFELKSKGAEQTLRFSVAPQNNSTGGSFHAEATIAGKTISTGIQRIDYPHIPMQAVFPRADGKLVRVDLKKNGSNIGYINGSGDGIPEALRQVGYTVTLLSDEDLMVADLSKYDALIAGIRAYNTRNALRNAKQRLLDYVSNGGTFLVQYNTTQDLMQDALGPYPLKISRDRVSVEDAPVSIIDGGHPVLNTPNKITQEDFNGWVQERGLYFPGEWDPQYQTILATNDPGEPQKPGGMLYTKYGKGVYIYSAYSWFRQLPAGVPGAYRLFINLISAN